MSYGANDRWISVNNSSGRIGGSNFFYLHPSLTDDPNGDGSDPDKDNNNEDDKKKKKKKYTKEPPPPIDLQGADLKETDMKNHLSNYETLYNDIKYREPAEVLLICPKCIAMVKFKKLRKEQGAVNPLNMQEVLIYYCERCYHKFSDLYANTFPHATISNLCKWCSYAGQFMEKVKIYEFPN